MRFLCAIRIVCWRVSVFYVAAVSAIPAAVVPCGGRVLHGHLLALPLWCLQGGLGDFGRPLTLPLWCLKGGLPSLLPVALAFSFLFAPYPPAPFPSGEGGDFLFSDARGSAPCIPGIRPPAALTEPAMQVTGGGACPPALPARRALAAPGGGRGGFGRPLPHRGRGAGG